MESSGKKAHISADTNQKMPSAKHKKLEKPPAKSKRGIRLRTKDQVIAHRAIIAKLLLQGYDIIEVANKLEISYEQARQDVRAVREEWKKSTIFDMDELKTSAIRNLAAMQSAAWAAFNDSKSGTTRNADRFGKNAKKRLKRNPESKEKIKSGLALLERIVTTENSNGDPAFLRLAMDCQMAICRVGGILQTQRGEDIPQLPNGGNSQATVILLPAQTPPRPPPVTPEIDKMKSAKSA